MKRILLITIAMFVFFFADAQSYYLNESNSGFNLGASFSDQKESSYFSISPGYTFEGRAHIDLSIGLGNLKSYNQKSTSISPSISYSILKQGIDNIPISLTSSLFYAYQVLDNIDNLSINSFGAGLGLHHKFNISESFSIIPGGYMSWQRSTLYYLGESENSSGFYFALDAALLFKVFYIGPHLDISKNGTSFAIEFGLVIPRK